MQLIERRIGLLFAVFLLAAGDRRHQGRLARRRQGATRSSARRSTQQEADIAIPAQRGSITDANGTDLAVSEPAVDIAATPLPDRRRDEGRGAARAADRHAPRTSCCASSRSRDTSFVYLARGVPAAKADRRGQAQDRRARVHPALPARLPARLDRPRSCSAPPAPTSRASAGSSTASTSSCAGADGERRLVKDAMGNPIEMRDTKPVEPGHDVRLTLDANLQDRAEEVLNEVGRDVAAQGRDRDRDGARTAARSSRSPTGRA